MGDAYTGSKEITMEDKTLVCADCGQEFIFSAGEQEFYKQMGFTNEPKRCKNCRNKRKAERNARIAKPAENEPA